MGIELAGEQAAVDHGFGVAAGVVAPGLLPRALVPEVALGAGHAGGAFRADGLRGQTGRLGADAYGRGPGKGRGLAAGAAAQGIIAEGGVHEFHPGLERVGVFQIGLAQVAQAQHVALVEVRAALGRRLHQDARGAGIADVQDQVHVHRRVPGRIDDLHGHVPDSQAHDVQPGEIAG